jgi:hypothetical protein
MWTAPLAASSAGHYWGLDDVPPGPPAGDREILRNCSARNLDRLCGPHPALPFWVVQSSTEEAVVRGYLLQISALQLPSWLALGISSVIFGIAHLDFHPLVLTNITLAAFCFSFVALGQGSLWMACGIHAGWNYTQGSLLGIPVSGSEREGSIWALGPAQGAPEWLTGGDFGIEGGAAATVVLAIAVVISFVYYRRCEEIRQRPTLLEGVRGNDDTRSTGSPG